eukprot:1046096-Pyramimonas_sp.AAC.1
MSWRPYCLRRCPLHRAGWGRDRARTRANSKSRTASRDTSTPTSRIDQRHALLRSRQRQAMQRRLRRPPPG